MSYLNSVTIVGFVEPTRSSGIPHGTPFGIPRGFRPQPRTKTFLAATQTTLNLHPSEEEHWTFIAGPGCKLPNLCPC
jgi:hypothetical protein